MCSDDENEDDDEDDNDDNDDDEVECTDKKPRFCRKMAWLCDMNERVQKLCRNTCGMCSDNDDNDSDDEDDHDDGDDENDDDEEDDDQNDDDDDDNQDEDDDGDEDDNNGDEDDEGDTDEEDECKDEKPTWWCNRKKRACKRNQHIQNLCRKTCEMCSDVDNEDDSTTTCEDTSGFQYCIRRKWK